MKPPPINTNVRLFDLVRFMRSELHQADLITDEEYAWLCAEAPLAKGGGSPSPRRLEDYDDMRTTINNLREALSVAKLAHAMMKPWETATLEYARKHREACEQIVALASGWDADGALGPRPPLSWESVARCAMDYAKHAIAATAPHG